MNENFSYQNISSCSSIGVIFIRKHSSFNSSSKKHDGIVILHYVFKLVVFHHHLCLVHMLDCFGVDIFCVSSSMVWTSLFDKLNSYAFSRPCVGRIEYLFVLVLEVLNIYSSMGWTCSNPFLIVQGFYLVLYLDECTL